MHTPNSMASSFFSTAMKHNPFRNTSTGTSSSESSSELKDEGPLDPDSDPTRDKSGLSRIFLDAVRFGEVLAGDKCGDIATPSAEYTSTLEAQAHKPSDKDDDATSVRRFAELIGRDLGKPDLAASERLAKLSVNTWARGSGEFGGVLTTEPEPIEGIADAGDVAAKARASNAQLSTPAHDQNVDIGGLNLSIDISKLPPVKSYTNLTPGEIVKLLVDDFGPLVTSEDDEENLLAEVDAAYFQEVAILVRLSRLTQSQISVAHVICILCCTGRNARYHPSTLLSCLTPLNTTGSASRSTNYQEGSGHNPSTGPAEEAARLDGTFA
jgi:sterol 3beta-glucosyltransferase